MKMLGCIKRFGLFLRISANLLFTFIHIAYTNKYKNHILIYGSCLLAVEESSSSQPMDVDMPQDKSLLLSPKKGTSNQPKTASQPRNISKSHRPNNSKIFMQNNCKINRQSLRSKKIHNRNSSRVLSNKINNPSSTKISKRSRRQ